jgi:WD40 repeat protein
VWDLWGDGTPLTITDHADRVEALEFSPGGTLLATGGRDRTLGVWDARTGASALPLVQHFGWLEDMDFSPDGSLLVTAGEDARVHVHDVASGKLLRVLHAEQAFKRVWMDHSVAFSPDGLLYSGSTGGDLLAWDPSTGEEKLRVDSPSVSSEIDISPDGSTIAMIDAWGSIVTVDAKTGKTLAKLDPPKGSWGYHFVRWTDGGKRLVSTGMDSGLRYWEPKSGKLLEDVQLDHTVYQLLVPPEPGILYIRSYDELVTYVHAKGGTWKKKGKRRCEGEAALSPDGTLLALAGKSTIEIRDRGTGAAIQKIVPGESVLGLAFGPDGTVLATSHDDGTVDLWRIGGQ